MDGYVTKPLKPDELLAAMGELTGDRVESATDRPLPEESEGAVFNREEALAIVDGDMELFREVVGLFMEEYPRTMAEIAVAIDGGDVSKLNRAAHVLKGSVGNFGARSAFETALRLEMMGKEKDLNGAGAVYSSLAEEVDLLKQALAEFMGDEKP
jgi:HPt (histidine-containing phosphotransfer) domain-containing protein